MLPLPMHTHFAVINLWRPLTQNQMLTTSASLKTAGIIIDMQVCVVLVPANQPYYFVVMFNLFKQTIYYVT
jgi:uncharacterized membrane protein YvbJ